jgi:hypothetical protein
MTFRCRASFSVALLNEELPLEMVAQILGNSPRIVRNHHSSFVENPYQDSLEAAVRSTWNRPYGGKHMKQGEGYTITRRSEK